VKDAILYLNSGLQHIQDHGGGIPKGLIVVLHVMRDLFGMKANLLAHRLAFTEQSASLPSHKVKEMLVHVRLKRTDEVNGLVGKSVNISAQ